jgi:hypothetical protein
VNPAFRGDATLAAGNPGRRPAAPEGRARGGVGLSYLRRISARTGARDRFGGWHPLLFAAYPVLFLWSENLGDTPLVDALLPLICVVLAAALATLVVGVVVRGRDRAALIVTPLALGLLIYGQVVDAIDLPVAVHRLAWVGLVALGALGAWRLSADRVARIDRALTAVGATLVVFTIISILPYQVEAASAAPPPDLDAGRVLDGETDAPKRDVYWLVFDRYPSDRAIDLQFGVRNDLTPWLREQDFAVLDDSHANYVTTSLSLTTTLNMAHLEDVTGPVESGAVFRKRVIAGLQSSRVVRQFKALGYRYHHIGSWWDPTRTDEAADVNYNAQTMSDFMTVLLDTSAAPPLLRALGVSERSQAKAYVHGKYGLDALQRVSAEPGPKLVVAHILLPHPAYVFDRDGSYIPATESRAMGESDAWQRQFDYTNSRIRSFLEPLLALPEGERPIVILQADEGHRFEAAVDEDSAFDWSTASGEELEIKFGILNAWYVPDGVDLGLEPDQTAINTFPILFDRYFGLDGYERLSDRITADTWSANYELTDITPRLPSLAGSTSP